MNLEKRISLEELCAGIGATKIALERVKKRLDFALENVAIAEIDKSAIKAYMQLHGPVLNLGNVLLADFGSHYCVFLSFTSPCTDLSSLGKKTGFKMGLKNSSAIIWELKRILATMTDKPVIIFIENVKNMVTVYRETFDELVAFLEKEGYHVYWKVLDAKDYGVPQHRERVYLIASLKEVNFEFPEPIKREVFLKDILEKDVPDKYYLKGLKEYFIKHSMETNYSFRVHNPSYADFAYTLTTKSGSRISDNFVFEHDISTDSVVRVKEKFLDKHGISLETIKNTRIRKLTRGEVMTLMGLEKEEQEKLSNLSDTAIFKLMGNSICIPVLEAIFYNFFKAYFES